MPVIPPLAEADTPQDQVVATVVTDDADQVYVNQPQADFLAEAEQLIAAASTEAEAPPEGALSRTGPVSREQATPDEGDTLYAKAEGGIVSGRVGNDRIYGSAGNDLFSGNGGDDLIRGHDGSDALNGGDGTDLLFGGDGDDIIIGERGDDRLYGDAGNDLVYGNDGNDRLRGGDGDDTLSGAEGADVLLGDLGNDSLFGGAGNDFLSGYYGIDYLDGGVGDDTLKGGANADTFAFPGTGGGYDVIKDFHLAEDVIDLSGSSISSFQELEGLFLDRKFGVKIDFGKGDALFLSDVEASDLTEDHFILAQADSERAASIETPSEPNVSLVAEAVAGRVTTLDLKMNAADVLKVDILSKPDFGNVSVNPDNTLALVLTGTQNTEDTSFSVRVTEADGSVRDYDLNIDVTPSPQPAGWGTGDNFYMLETDADDRVIVETGDNHRAVYVSNSEDALTLADIAAIEDLNFTDEGQWWSFLKSNEDYGSSPDMALSEEAGNMLWKALTYPGQPPHSNHLYLERGYTYDEIQLISGKNFGESELNPILIGAYGEGDRPVVETRLQVVSATENVVIRDIELSAGGRVFTGSNYLLENVVITDEELDAGTSEGFTIRDSEIYDVFRDAPVDGSLTWSPHENRISGFYISNADGVLFEGNLFDHNGWEDGYSYDLSAANGQGQPPSMFSHNLYLPTSLTDVTIRDNIISQAASSGIQMRPGGFIEDNLFLDNNGAVFFAGDETFGNFTLLSGNVVTSAGHKLAESGIGEVSYGITSQAYMPTLIDNIVTHLADPNNPEEIEAKFGEQHAVVHSYDDPYFDNTIVYNWEGSGGEAKNGTADDRNLEGLDTDVLDQTTIQNFAATLLGEGAGISDLVSYIRFHADGALDDTVDADVIIAFFREGFGLEVDIRADAETLRFVPDDLGDGVRWDNRLNWTTDDLPGTQDGDRVELAGNWVEYAGAGTTSITDLDFGEDGRLNVTSGKLTIEDHMSVGEDGAGLSIDGAGQFWTNGFTDQDLLMIAAEGGRYANTGLHTGKVEMDVSDNAQVLLATDGADYVMGEGSTLSIHGGRAEVGFDGTDGGTGVLLMSQEATLEFVAEDDVLGQIAEFNSGHFGTEGGNIQSGVNLGNALLRVDVSDLAGQGNVQHDLIRADEIVGKFGAVEIDGLDATQNALLTVDYENDIVRLTLGTLGIGTGAVGLEVLGEDIQNDMTPDIYAALTNGHGIYDEDLPVHIPSEADDDPFPM